MTDFSPREIVSELDRFNRRPEAETPSVRVYRFALRNRWRRLLQRSPAPCARRCCRKNILMISGADRGLAKTRDRAALGKNSPARRFIKVEATNIHRGRLCRAAMVEQIIRESRRKYRFAQNRASESARGRCRTRAQLRRRGPRARCAGRPPKLQPPRRATRFRKKIAGRRNFNDKEIEGSRRSSFGRECRCFEIPGMPGRAARARISIGDIFGKKIGRPEHKTRRLTVEGFPTSSSSTRKSDKLLDQRSAGARIDRRRVWRITGIVFLDEIDKICRARWAVSAAERLAARGPLQGAICVAADRRPTNGVLSNKRMGRGQNRPISCSIASGAFHIAQAFRICCRKLAGGACRSRRRAGSAPPPKGRLAPQS